MKLLGRLLLVVVATGWLSVIVVGGGLLGLEAAREERAALIGQALEDPVVVAQLRDDATAAAVVAAPEVTALVEPLLGDALVQTVAAQPVVARLVAAEVDQQLGLGHEAVVITPADLPDDVTTLTDRFGVDFSVELEPARKPSGLIDVLSEVAIGLLVVTIALHFMAARVVGRSKAAFAGCVGVGMALVALTTAVALSSATGDPIRSAIVATAIPNELLIGLGVVLTVSLGRTLLAHFGHLRYGALSPERLGFVDDYDDWGDLGSDD